LLPDRPARPGDSQGLTVPGVRASVSGWAQACFEERNPSRRLEVSKTERAFGDVRAASARAPSKREALWSLRVLDEVLAATGVRRPGDLAVKSFTGQLGGFPVGPKSREGRGAPMILTRREFVTWRLERASPARPLLRGPASPAGSAFFQHLPISAGKSWPRPSRPGHEGST